MDLLTAKEASEMLRVNVSTLSNWRYAGIGPQYVKLGEGRRAAVRYSRKHLQNFIERNQRCVTNTLKL